MENETGMAVLPAILIAILSFLEIIFIPGLIFKIIALVITQIVGTGYIFYIYKDFSSHFNYIAVTYSGFGLLLFLIDMGWLTISIPKSAIFAAHIISFIVPVLFCFVVAFILRETQRNFFGEFFLGQCLLLAISLLLFYIYWFGRFNLDRSMTVRTIRFIPFATLASFVENFIYGSITGKEFARYLSYSIVVFIPLGYLLGVLGNSIHKITELLLALLIPVALEFIQYIFVLNTCDIDDMLLGFLGAVIGIGCYELLNLISLYRSGASLIGESRHRD